MLYSTEVQRTCHVAKGPNHGPAPIPQQGRWMQAREIKDISGLTHGVIEEAHIEMMGFLGVGNNPMVGASVAVAVALAQAQSKA